MKKFREAQDKQMYLLPLSVQDFVPAKHPAHFIKRVVKEELELKEIKVSYIEERGAPPFSPEVMTSLLLYGYMRKTYSSRELARACEERFDFSLITGMNKPNHRTIAKFRKRHATALKGLFAQVLQLCIEAKIVDLKHVAIDGTRIKANAAKDQNVKYKNFDKKIKDLEANVNEWLKESDKQDQAEDAEYGENDRGDGFVEANEALERYREAKKRLEQRKKAEYEARKEAVKKGELPREHAARSKKPKADDKENLVDPDSRVMKTRDGYQQAYNCQLGVDRKNHVIVSAHVSSNEADMWELKVALEQMNETLNCYPKEVSLDTGYHSEQNLKLLEEAGIRGYVAGGRDVLNPKRKPPAGSLRHKMLNRLRMGGKRSRYRIRKETVETVNGNIKAARGFKQFLTRGINLVSLEFSLVCSVHNLWKLFNYKMA